MKEDLAEESFGLGEDVQTGAEPGPYEETTEPSRWHTDIIPPKDIYDMEPAEEDADVLDEVMRSAKDDADRLRDGSPDLRPALEALLADQEALAFRDVWDAYCGLKPEEQAEFRPRVVVYLARSQSIVETGRGMSIAHLVGSEQWDNDFVSAAVLLSLRSRNQKTAASFFTRGLQEKGLEGGFDYLLLDAVNRQQWSDILDVWESYYAYLTAQEDQGLVKKPLESLASLPSLGALYFALERFLSRAGSRKARALSGDLLAHDALNAFRRRFAKEALLQGCPPRQATVILEFWQDTALFHRYLMVMFEKWRLQKISDSVGRELMPIYYKFRKMDGAKPQHEILRGVFELHFPAGEAELERLYDDWIRFHGELSKWGFDKFTKFYATIGDTERVRQLQDRCLRLYPDLAESPQAFRGILNAYAQNADMEGAEEEFRTMTEKYGIKPDLSSWNLLLKCYSRAGDEAKAKELFEKICTVEEPNSWTYAHVMALTSKRGDLPETLRYFGELQKRRVPLTEEITLSLIVAYCKNDKLVEAEKVCFELAGRGLTSSAAWSQLINLSGMKGQLKNCYALLNKMKDFNLEWDSQIISSLLRALVQVKQIYPAYDVIRDHAKSRSHLLQPDHFNIVLGGAARTHNRNITESLMLLMEKTRIKPSFNCLVAYSHGILRTAPSTLREHNMGAQLLESLDALATTPSDVRRRRQDTSRLGEAVRVLIRLREFDHVEALLTKFDSMFPPGEANSRGDIVSALILAYFHEQNYEKIHELWNKAWPEILKRRSRPDGQGIYPAYQYDLTSIVFHMTNTFAAQKDGEGLLKMVQEVTKAGFKLSSNTWDRIIRCLTHLDRWEPAMTYCETLLMPNWPGWYSEKIPYWRDTNPDKRERRQLERWEHTNTRLLRPTTEAVVILENKWLQVRRLAAWSPDAARTLERVEQSHPLLLSAFMTSRWMDGWGPYVFRGHRDLGKAFVMLLAPLTTAELRGMRKTLEAELSQAHGSKAVKERFKRQVASSGRPQPLRKSELVLLKNVLSKNLAKRASPQANQGSEAF